MTEPTSDADGGPGLEGVVRELLGDLAGVEPGSLAPGASMEQLELDSLDAGEFLVQLEEATGVGFDVRQLGGDWSELTVDGLVALIARELDHGAQTPT